MPVLYVVRHGGNFVSEATPSSDIVYLVCSLKEVIDSEIPNLFTDGHATDKFTTFYDRGGD